jgi:thioredoxin-related protein
MKHEMKPPGLWLWVITLGLSVGLLLESLPAAAAKTTEFKWYGYEEGTKKARESNRPVFLFFYTDWCTWCKKMENDTLVNPQIQGTLSLSFVPIRINAESKDIIKVDGKQVKTYELARKYAVRGFPTTIFLESDGSLIGPLPGYVDTDTLRKILLYVREKAYQKMSFEEFTRQPSEFRATGH